MLLPPPVSIALGLVRRLSDLVRSGAKSPVRLDLRPILARGER